MLTKKYLKFVYKSKITNSYSGRLSQFYGLLLLGVKQPFTASNMVQCGPQLSQVF